VVADRWPVLTIRQPWCWAIVHGGKPVENRGWNMKHRGPLWLHAGARSRWDVDGGSSPLVRGAWDRWLRATYGTTWAGLPFDDVTLGRKTTLMPFGAIVALVEVTGCHYAYSPKCCPDIPALGTEVLQGPCSPWAADRQYHIELANVRPLAEPVPCRGALKLWPLPEDVEKAVREQLEASGG
jgi:hypothetical protein